MPARKYFFALAAAIVLLLLERWVTAGESMGFDLWMRDTLHAWASSPATHVLLAITMLGSEWVIAPLGTVLVWRLASLGRGRQAMLFALGILSAELVSNLLKLAFHRARPPVFFGLSPAGNYSFPSGHAFVGAVFYGLLAAILIGRWPHHRAAIVTATALTMAAIGVSRVYLGYHYPSDVMGGWTCAAGWLALYGPPVHAAGEPQEQRH